MTYRLIALDMDGTLLDGEGKFPPGFDEILRAAHEQGVVLAPASGRQLGTLVDMFDGLHGSPDGFIAENGAVVAHEGEIVSTSPMPTGPVHAIIDAALARGFVPVVCRPLMAHVPADLDAASTAEIDKYYHATSAEDDLHAIVDGEVVKVAVYREAVAEAEIYPVLRAAAPGLNVVVSGANWVDAMDPAVDKGVALRALARALAVKPHETAAFGDYLNDYALLEAAGTAWAMDNAHPDLKEIADHIAPANTEHGVAVVLRDLLGL
ncbi:HAD family hydrolase [Corynebacterium guangdongense]|uniref:Cof subfamily protein (Haloacid dehalogenase superfamily) n=1 Tax=Corynebacterium guangdongense TaxID=1783348 RepID=A0ABU1ZVB0_9CORY|nr:HAD family hydrolase [Corynebacterium guangdongense]MDR7328868.1 Cof subfamily protein (haloacid dehalogenase superfamily) [Corynebacterium guangdongense]WJZ17443.1 Sugar phosphatase YidA [Corynebacterium guangdongense]